MSWRRTLEVLAGLAIGAICLVAWSSTSSAAGAEPPPPPPPPGLLTGLTGPLLPPVQDLTSGLGLGPLVDPVVDDVVAPTVVALDGTVTGVVTSVTTPVGGLPSLPGPGPSGPGLPGLPDPGQPQVPALPLPGSGVLAPVDPVGAATVPPARGVAENAASAPTGPTTAADVAGRRDGSSASLETFSAGPADDGSSSAPLPFELPALPTALVGAGGALVSSASGASSVGLALLAVLAGVAAVAPTSVWRRLALHGLLTPRAMSYAIATPPG